jgi:hypothetical protein
VLATYDCEQYDEAMKSLWRSFRALFVVPGGVTVHVARDIGRFGIGFCPGCKRLRGAPGLRCDYCGSTRPVIPDA